MTLTSRPALRPRFGALDPAALAKAEAALSSLSGQFDGWIKDEIVKLKAAHAGVVAQGVTSQAGEQLHTHAHDLKGLGTTYGYPLVTRLAASLCKLTGDAAARSRAPAALVTAHVNAICTVVDREMRSETDPVGVAMAKMLESGSAHAG